MQDIVPRQDFPRKRCTGECKQEYPSTTQYFYPQRASKDGLTPWCRECSKAHARYRHKHPKVKPIIPEGCKRCDDCKHDFPATSEYFHAYKRSKDGLRNPCKECRSKRDKGYQQADYAGYLARNERYRKRHPKRVREADRRYRQTPKGRRNSTQRQRRYRMRYPERMLQGRNRYYWSHLEKEHAYSKGYRVTHRDYFHAAHALRRARLKNAPGTYTSAQIQEQLKRQHYRCYYAACGRAKFEKRNGKYIYHIEHTIPLSRPEALPCNEISHIVLACPTCNKKKGKKLPHEWFEGGRLL